MSLTLSVLGYISWHKRKKIQNNMVLMVKVAISKLNSSDTMWEGYKQYRTK